MEPHKIFHNDLPLQTETSVFILLNVLDIFLTYLLLLNGAIEANPMANLILELWDFVGLIVFKLIVVAVVCIIAQLVATRRLNTGRILLIAGSFIVGGVVVYSVGLLVHQVS